MRWVELVAWFALVLHGNFVIGSKPFAGRVSLMTGSVDSCNIMSGPLSLNESVKRLIGLLLYPGPRVDHSGCNIVSHQDRVTSEDWTEDEPVLDVLLRHGETSGHHRSLVKVNILVIVSLHDELSLHSTQLAQLALT